MRIWNSILSPLVTMFEFCQSCEDWHGAIFHSKSVRVIMKFPYINVATNSDLAYLYVMLHYAL